MRDRESTDDVTGPFRPAVDAFDQAVDGWFEPLRRNPAADRVFYAASAIGDFSLIWHVLGAWKGLLPGGKPRDAVRLSAVMAIESALVNQGVKRLFGRVRPNRGDGGGERNIRQPITSSFPSGHASAAMTAAAMLSRRSRIGVVYYALGAVVATSRIHVKMHHASDVAAGAVTGAVIGRVASRVLDAVERS